MKFMTLGEAETKRQKAVSFLRRIGQDEDAERFEGMDARQYAEHKGAELVANPNRSYTTMPRGKSKAELQAELDEAQDHIEELEAKLDDIAGLASGEDEEEENEDLEDDEEEEE
jgi:hypothetical protein